MEKGKVTVAILQHACSTDQKENKEKAKKMVRAAAAKGAKIICLQELFTGRYFPQTIDVAKYDWAEPVPGPTTEEFQPLAKELGVVLLVPVYEYVMDGVYFNTVTIFDADGTYLGKYRKNHIPEGPQYIEKYYFTPGDLGYPVFQTKYGKVAVLICWDEWFPEPSRIVALKGADIVFYPSAIGSEPDNPDLDTSEPWMTAIRAHGICNNMYVAAVNRVGVEDDMTFYGRSFISGPWGEILAESIVREDEVVIATCDFSEIKKSRDVLQFHRDRRVDTYQEILKKVIQD
jgi:N-carbamoylputrescine amidase